MREEISSTIQETPSASPSPLTALQATIDQCLFAIESNANISLISSQVNDPGKSCLLASINREAPASFSSSNSFDNSSLQSSSLLLSAESITQINPSVCSK